MQYVQTTGVFLSVTAFVWMIFQINFARTPVKSSITFLLFLVLAHCLETSYVVTMFRNNLLLVFSNLLNLFMAYACLVFAYGKSPSWRSHVFHYKFIILPFVLALICTCLTLALSFNNVSINYRQFLGKNHSILFFFFISF